MLALLSAPRGRVSAARLAAHVRERDRAAAHRGGVRAGPTLAAPAAPAHLPRALPAAAVEPAQP